MSNRQPRLVVLISILLLAGSSCGDDATGNRGASITQGGPMSIVTTTVTPVPTGPPNTLEPAETTVTAAADPTPVGNAPVGKDRLSPIVAIPPEALMSGAFPSSVAAILGIPAPTLTEQPSLPEDPVEVLAVGESPQWWRPELQEEAFWAIDPGASGADLWYEEKYTFGTAPHHFYRFYHMRGDEQTELWRGWQRTLDVFLRPPVIYYPVRYDLSWHDSPDTVKVVATWPLGEQRELLVTDGEPLAEIELPPGPPLPPTTPYTDPQFPETATLLGRDCPPVEQLWSLDAPVEDPCTRAAVRTAFQFAHGAATPRQIQAAVRDGHVLGETIAQLKDIANQDSFSAYWFDPANPGHYLAEVRNVRWAGMFAGAARISAEFRLYARPGLAQPEMQVLARAKIGEQVDQGSDVPEGALGEELSTGPPPPDQGFWDRMMVVRTADGTWRMSYPMWCFSMERKTKYESVSCPDDPNPVWSDSIWDFDLYPPNHLSFWLNATPRQRENRGVPPS